MVGMALAPRHRRALCETALAAGPEAPTLCPPWTVRALVAHLVLRETRPDAAAGVVVPALAARTERVQADLAASEPFEDLVRRFADGPPAWSPTRLGPVDDTVNLVEFVVHHEDIRRALPGWQPAPLDEASERAVWTRLRRTGRLLLRSAPVGVVLVVPDTVRAAVKGPPPRGTGLASVVLTGRPLELLLHVSGRTAVSEVEVGGDPESVRAYTEHVSPGA
jgi:uncharacterized protein (TIGR03085 family)